MSSSPPRRRFAFRLRTLFWVVTYTAFCVRVWSSPYPTVKFMDGGPGDWERAQWEGPWKQEIIDRILLSAAFLFAMVCIEGLLRDREKTKGGETSLS